jgi:hypothetical protein
MPHFDFEYPERIFAHSEGIFQPCIPCIVRRRYCDIPHNAFALEIRIVRRFHDHANESVAGYSGKRVISFHQFQIGSAYARSADFYQRFSRQRFGYGQIVPKTKFFVFQPKRFHFSFSSAE